MTDTVQKDEIKELNETFNSAFTWFGYDHNAEGSHLESSVMSGLFKSHYCELRYTFQIQNCEDEFCCSPSTAPDDLKWLPDPQLKEDEKHFISYSMKLESTDETDRSTIKQIASELSKKKGKFAEIRLNSSRSKLPLVPQK